jgi:hypothetical protein
MGSPKRMLRDVRCIAVQAGVAVECSEHPGYLFYQGTEDTERLAYAKATDRWKCGDYGPIVTLREVMDAVEDAINHLPSTCRRCAAT